MLLLESVDIGHTKWLFTGQKQYFDIVWCMQNIKNMFALNQIVMLISIICAPISEALIARKSTESRQSIVARQLFYSFGQLHACKTVGHIFVQIAADINLLHHRNCGHRLVLRRQCALEQWQRYIHFRRIYVLIWFEIEQTVAVLQIVGYVIHVDRTAVGCRRITLKLQLM